MALHESYLEKKTDAFMEVKDKLKYLDGDYLTEDIPRAEIRRYRATEAVFEKGVNNIGMYLK